MEKIKTGYKVIFAIVFATIFLALSLGLYAILNHKGGMGASINFTATGVSGTITGEVKAYNSTKFDITKSDAYDKTLIEQSTYSATFSPRTHSMADWNVGLIRFLPNDINYTGIVGLDLTITNTGTKPILLTFPSPTFTATNVAMQYAFKDKTTATTINKTVQFAGLGIDNFSIAANSSFDISLQLYIPDRKAFASSTDIQIDINLTEDVSTNKAVTYANLSDSQVSLNSSALPQKLQEGQDLTLILDYNIGNLLENVYINNSTTPLVKNTDYIYDFNSRTLTIKSAVLSNLESVQFSTIGSQTFVENSGTSLDPVEISEANELVILADLVNNDVEDFSTKTYKLTTPVDLDGVDYQAIGTDSNPFQGTFNGNDQQISNLTINQPTKNFLGLFGYAKNSTIDSVVIEGGSVMGAAYMGGIVGYAKDSTIVKNCVNKAEINGRNTCGGIVGSLTGGSVVEGCINQGNVLIAKLTTGYDPSVGGIAGWNSGIIYQCQNLNCDIIFTTELTTGDGFQFRVGGISGTDQGRVEQCFNSGNIIDQSNGYYSSYVGGIVGLLRLAVAVDCYNIGEIIGGSKSGGVCGALGIATTGTVGEMINCYSTKYPNNSAKKGGLCGMARGTTKTCRMINSYYLSIADGVVSGEQGGNVLIQNCSSLTDAQMQLEESFIGWDFENVWTFDSDSDYKYPVLRCFL